LASFRNNDDEVGGAFSAFRISWSGGPLISPRGFSLVRVFGHSLMRLRKVSQTDPRMDAERMGAGKNRMALGIERDRSILGFNDGILPAVISRLDFLDSSPLIPYRCRQSEDV